MGATGIDVKLGNATGLRSCLTHATVLEDVQYCHFAVAPRWHCILPLFVSGKRSVRVGDGNVLYYFNLDCYNT